MLINLARLTLRQQHGNLPHMPANPIQPPTTSKHSIAHNSNKQVARIMKGSEFCTGPKAAAK